MCKINVLAIAILLFLVVFPNVSEGSGLEIDNSVKPIEINAGQDFTIKLQSNATTGYQWKIDGNLDEKIVKFVRSDYEASPLKMMGSGGWEFWTFKAKGKGITKIHMVYVRPWEKKGFKEKTKTFTVIVR